MIAVSNTLISQYVAVLKQQEIQISQYGDYKKWLRFFLDFCTKYPEPKDAFQRVQQFLDKLREKKQSEEQRKQAAHAIALYCDMQEMAGNEAESIAGASIGGVLVSMCAIPEVPSGEQQYIKVRPGSSHYCEAGYQEKSDSPEWDELISKLAGEIKVRHYSRKTLKTYALWSRQFQRFLKNKPPEDLTTDDVKEYLTYLAVKCKVAASTQNQAFNSLLFLFRHALKKEFGILKDVPRAKKSLYIPMVLSKQEIDAILAQLSYPYNLFIKVLFGCGLRLFEGLQLRVKDFNFNAGVLTVHGKGKKDRTVPIPESILPELKAQIEVVGRLHDKDIGSGYDIRTIQNLLGHSSLKTTMIYTHCVPVRTIKEPKSPLDF